MVGPFYGKRDGDGVIIGVLVEEKHCNTAGNLHGGLLSTLSDIALGNSVGVHLDKSHTGPPEKNGTPAIATVSLSSDFMGTARMGDWVEARASAQKVGGTLAYANVLIYREDEVIAKASGIFRMIAGRPV